MRKKFIALSIVLGLAGVITLGCSGGGTTSQTPPSVGPTGSVAIFGGDSPVCDVISFDVTLTGATLTPQGGGTPVSVISSSSPQTVDFAALMDFFTVLNFATVPAGTYDQITLTLSNPQITILDTTKTPPAPTPIAATLTSSTVTVNIEPPLTVTANKTAGLNVDFRLRKSLQTDPATGSVTGSVNPVFKVTTQAMTTEDGVGDDEDLKGLVQSVSTTSSNTSFTGSFVLQAQSGNTPTVEVTSNTTFDGLSGLSALAQGAFVEVEAFVDQNGNIVAKKVDVEEADEEGQKRNAFIGRITSVTRDTSGNVTQFNLFVREEHPEDTACVPEKSNLTVNVTSSTEFKIEAEGTNRAGLAFTQSALGLGQHVTVHGQCQAGPPPSVNAHSIHLRLQTILGNFAALLAAASDGKTGGFTLTPCSAIFNGQPITVFTFAETAFANVNQLSGLTPAPELAVKGLLLYEQQPLTVNTISVTPPAAVFEAKQVHQFGPDE